MKKILEIHPLDSNQINFLLKQSQPRTFNVSESLVYDGQVPFAGYVLLSGKITIEKKGNLIREIPAHSMICVKELLANKPLKHCVRIAPGSEALILDKSTVLELMEEEDGVFLSA